MSRASAAVLFPDGTIRYAIYCGTADQLWPCLFDTTAEAWDAYGQTKADNGAWLKRFFPAADTAGGRGEPVRIFENYGQGMQWVGEATRDFVISELSTFEIDEIQDCGWRGQPEWVRWA
jgi:hypothetical protein